MSALRILTTAAAWTEAVEGMLTGCDGITAVAPWVDSDSGRWSVWQSLRAARSRVSRVYASTEDTRSEPAALAELAGWGALRWLPVSDASMRASLLRGNADGVTTTLLGLGPLAPAGLLAPVIGALLHSSHRTDTFDLEVDGLVHRVAQFAQVPTAASLDAYYAAYVAAKPARDQMLAFVAPLGLAVHVEPSDLDLVALTDTSEVSRASKSLKAALQAAATSTKRQTVAFHGGREDLDVTWNAALGIWSAQQFLQGRRRNVFGIEVPASGVALAITVEINVPHLGVDRKIGGAFARCRASGHTYLVHRGKIGGGAKGVGADLFWSRFRGGALMDEGEGERSRVVPVARIDGPGALADLAAFVHEIGRIKRLAAKRR